MDNRNRDNMSKMNKESSSQNTKGDLDRKNSQDINENEPSRRSGSMGSSSGSRSSKLGEQTDDVDSSSSDRKSSNESWIDRKNEH
jgi:hypothetical protein